MAMIKMWNKQYKWFNKDNRRDYWFCNLTAAILIIQYLFNPFNALKTAEAEAFIVIVAVFMAALGLFHCIHDRLCRLEDKTGMKIWK